MEIDELETEEIFLYVNFNKKIRDDVFQNKIFFRLANIETENPLVQLNDYLFKGEYEDCVGTNLFFEDVEDPQPRCIFEGESSIRLKHTVTQYKILSLKPVGIPSKLKDIPQPDYEIKINSNYDYETLLKKLANNSLVLEEDLIIVPRGTLENISSVNNQISPTTSKTKKKDNTIAPSEKKDVEMQVISEGSEQKLDTFEGSVNNGEDNSEESQEVESKTIDILTYKYEKLKKLARKPNRRKIKPDLIAECDPKYQKAYEYNCIKSQILKPSDYFPVISKDFNKETLIGAVDIDRSVIHGIIKPSTEYYRMLTEEEKAALLSMENMHNLSMPARYWVLKSQLDYLESLKLTCSEEELNKKDKYGRTIDETIYIYKRLCRVLNGIVEQNYFYNSEVDTDDDDSSNDNSVREVDTDREDASGDISGESIDNTAETRADTSGAISGDSIDNADKRAETCDMECSSTV